MPTAAEIRTPGEEMSVERRVVLYSGRVQGVGFRQVTVDFGLRYALGGTVKNLPDGKVELVVEGDATEIKSLLADVADHFRGYISRTVERIEPPTGLEPPVRVTW